MRQKPKYKNEIKTKPREVKEGLVTFSNKKLGLLFTHLLLVFILSLIMVVIAKLDQIIGIIK